MPFNQITTNNDIGGGQSPNTSMKKRDNIYYSGANVKVYFGDVWVKELASIQYSIEEQVAPVYGFNSYMFDKVARGTRLVSGAFIINHTDSGYINTILDRIAKSAYEEENSTMSPERLEALMQDVKTNNSNRNIENLLSLEGEQNYEDYIESLKSSYWGKGTISSDTMYRSGESKEYQPNYYADNEGSKQKNILKKHGFNILLDFSPSANVRDFQDCIRGMKNDNNSTQTYRSIIGVHLTGENQIIAPNGQPIQTQYNFIARDIDGDVSQLSMKYNQLDRYKAKVDIPARIEEESNIIEGESHNSIKNNNPHGDIQMLPD